MTKEVKDLINRKKQIYGQGDKMQLNRIQKELKLVIKTKKVKYKNNIEKTLTQNNMKKVWEGMRLMSGYSNKSGKSSQLPDTSVEHANKVNEFYNCFDKYDFHNEVDNLHDVLQQDLDPYELSVS